MNGSNTAVTGTGPAWDETATPNAVHLNATDIYPWASGQRSSRANNFDLIRLIFALGVIVSHAWPLTRSGVDSRPEAGEWVARLTAGQTSLGGICVNGFFVLSGYLILASRKNSPGLFDFLSRRVMRIYPGFIAAAVISFGVAGAAGAGWHFGVTDLVRRAAEIACLKYVYVVNAFPTNPMPNAVNGSLWTIQYEFLCYVLVATIGPLLLRSEQRGAAVLAIAIIVLCVVSVVANSSLVAGGSTVERLAHRGELLIKMVAHFGAGMAFYLGRGHIPWRSSWACVALGTLIVGGVVPPVLFIVSPLAMVYLVMWVGFHPRLRAHRFGKYGDFSYGTYLYAFVIQQCLVYYGVGSGIISNILIAMPSALIAGILSWHLCERHFVHFRLGGRRPDATALNHRTANPA